MANRRANFSAGNGTPSNTGVPVSSVNDSNIITPTADRPAPAESGGPSRAPRATAAAMNDTTRLLKEADSFTGKRTVKLRDAISITNQLSDRLHVVHQDALKTGKLHPDLAAARLHLFGDSQNFPEGDERGKGAVHHLQDAALYHNPEKKPIVKNGVQLTSTDSLAWDSLQKAGEKLHAAHRALLGVTPAAADVSVTHPVNGVPITFTPGSELLHITKNTTPFNPKGKAPKTRRVAGQTVAAQDVKAAVLRDEAVKKEGIGGVDTLREDIRAAAKRGLKGTRRIRKVDRGGKGPAPGQIAEGTSVFGDVTPGDNIPTRRGKTPFGKVRREANIPAKDPKAIAVEPMGKGVEGVSKPKKQPRTAPTEEAALKRVEREGK
jgi:hypothetical protein